MKYLKKILEIIFFILVLGIFCYSGYQIAAYSGIFKIGTYGASCQDCSSCGDNGWLSDLCQRIKDWCQNSCPCRPTPTSLPPEPTPTTVEPTPTGGPGEPTPTGEQQVPTPTPTSGGVGGTGGEGGGGGGGGGNPGPCVPPEAPKTPILLSATIVTSTSVKLTWTKVDRADHYLVFYGIESKKYIYGNSDVGNSDSYVVGGLTPGKAYYFAVSAGIGGGCPIASPNSNELRATSSYGQGGVLGVETDPPAKKEEGKLEGGIATVSGEVAGAEAGRACPYWWIVLAGQTLLLAGYYGVILRRKQPPRRWWLAAPAMVVLAYLIDHYAHTHWYVPSHMCPWEKWLGVGLASLETMGYRLLRKSA